MNIEDLTHEQKEKLKACETPEELLEKSREIGYELSEEELSAVSGGGMWSCSDDAPCDPYICGKVCASGSTDTATFHMASASIKPALM